MFKISKVYAAGELEHAIVVDVERHEAASENPATGAALRLVSHTAKEMLRQAPHGHHIAVRAQGQFGEDGTGEVRIELGILTAKEAEDMAAPPKPIDRRRSDAESKPADSAAAAEVSPPPTI